MDRWRVINPQFETGIVIEGYIDYAGDWLIFRTQRGGRGDVIAAFFRPLGAVLSEDED